MAKINKPDMQNIWAEAGTVTSVDSATISEGWVVEIPPFEKANFVENRQDTGVAYLLQMGIVEWDSTTEYQTGSYVQYDAIVYRSTGVNTNKQPDLFIDVNWQVAFDAYGSASEVQQELDALILDDDPFVQYVLKTNPTFLSKATGTSFSATVGTPTNNTSDVGFSFIDDGDTGLFKEGDDLVLRIDAVEKLKINKSPLPVFDSSNAPVTTSMLRSLMQNVFYRVGHIEVTMDNTNPLDYLGFGVWQRFGEGRAIVGYSSDVTSATPDWYKTAGNTYGEETTTLSVDNLPEHNHKQQDYYSGSTLFMSSEMAGDETCVGTVDSSQYSGSNIEPITTSNTGSSTPFNNIQPSIVVYLWRRVS
jgi:hypothetical protein